MDSPTTQHKEHGELSLMEEVLLLCLRNSGDVSKGIFGYSDVSTGNGLASAVILELSLASRLDMNEAGELSVVGEGTTNDELLDEALDIMKEKKNAKVDEWMKLINGTLVFHKGIKDFRERLYERLCKKGILREVKKVMGTKHTFKDVQTIDNVAEKIRHWGKITETAKVLEFSDHDYALLALFYALDKPFQGKMSNCLDINRIFPDTEERIVARKNIESLVNYEDPTKEAKLGIEISKKLRRKIFVWTIKVATMGVFSMLTEL